ncbi:MAG: transketolase [Candidatus Competibacteraceae bacterium]|uniref:Transketolase n=1 Tax=Candidatus Contendobacter odensis Run_B_J11 TaxID=1400861 RepID=A0A7U7G8P3_9GAMM|nr:transketolase [Candidatus Contendobacter odensis]MBK8537136.1 transketolase [Candidatus Competibacteraceae bacterium]MBK8755010.1 transketolase [Candidatus Competibacteraceae bacterium]CDH43635.1 transketolase [Candidatus Contendobacter odensis Run_B_J11]
MPSRSELAARRVDETLDQAVVSDPTSRESLTLSRRELANAIRALSMDAVQRAESGHPGAPMGMADFGEVLWNDFLRHNPANPKWFNRDRVILSNGHGSMLQYSLLHLSGYDLSIEDLRNFRRLGSRTPGHPEYGRTPGVETSTGPLGQGLANGVGMALAERALATRFNRPGFPIVDHYTYVILGDGCLMEGVSYEACSLAGTWGLGKLICLYDDNGISIDGPVRGWFSDNVAQRFEASGWHVIPGVDGHDAAAIHQAIAQARAFTDRPTLICCKTTIAWGSPGKGGSEKSHGAPLGAAEVAATREAIGWRHEPFVIPPEIYRAFDARAKGADWEEEWSDLFTRYRAEYPEPAAEFERRLACGFPPDWENLAWSFIHATQERREDIATRVASQRALQAYGPHFPSLVGGSADLTESTGIPWSGCRPVDFEHPDGNLIFYGAREFSMYAIMNGLALHGGYVPFGGTFLMFADYGRNAIRMAALIKLRCMFVLTHDSIGVGGDGPTHQPVEHVASLRLIPDLSVWRTCDTAETAVAWKVALERTNGPTALIFTRQPLPHQDRTPEQVRAIARGGYVLLDGGNEPEAIIIATGSEVQLAVAAARQLNSQGRRIRVVSMPSVDVFDAQDAAWRESVLPAAVTRRVVVEAGVTAPWYKYAGPQGMVIGIDCFGECGPPEIIFQHFGFTAERVAATVAALL